jgi:hypothetical protein
MAKAESLQLGSSSDEKTAAAEYDRLKALITIAKKMAGTWRIWVRY